MFNQSQGPALNIPKYEELTSKYSNRFASIRESVNSGQSVSDEPKGLVWMDDLSLEKQQEVSDSGTSFLDNNEVIRTRDKRFTGNKEQDRQVAMAELMNHPAFMELAPVIEEEIEGLVARVNDPEDPITEEEAQQMLVDALNAKLGPLFNEGVM